MTTMHCHLLRCVYTNCILESNAIGWVYEECLYDCYWRSSLYFSMGQWLPKDCQRAWPTTLFCTNFCTNIGNVCDSSTQWYTVSIALLQDTFLINLGNHRANIMNFFMQMWTANDFGALDFLVDEALSAIGQPLMIVFFNTCDLAYNSSKYLKQLLPKASHHEIHFLHAGHNRQARCKVLRDFQEGKVNIFCASEAVGMVYL